MSDKLKDFYCDAQIVNTITLHTKAKDADEAWENFQNNNCVSLNPLNWPGHPKAFTDLRTTPKKEGRE